MANQEHLDILKQGVDAWNKWREEQPDIRPDLSEAKFKETNFLGANLSGRRFRYPYLSAEFFSKELLLEAAELWKNLIGIGLSQANFSQTDLSRAELSQANLCGADLEWANLGRADLSQAYLIRANFNRAYLSKARLSGASLQWANLSKAHLNEAHLNGAYLNEANLYEAFLSGADLSTAYLVGADLRGADLTEAKIIGANLSNANLSGADLSRAILIGTNLTEAILINCRIYGISAWDVQLEGATQNSLVITPNDEPTITVDNLKVAQFIYLLLNNREIRDVIDTIAKKAVLILGRFTPERKAVLDALREAFRTQGYLPILFDFDKPASRDITETVSTLAHLARFIIADLTEPSSIPKELEAIVPTLAVPVQPLLEGLTRPYAMFKDYWKYHWMLEVYRYNGLEELLTSLKEHVIEPAELKAKELAKLRAQAFEEQ